MDDDRVKEKDQTGRTVASLRVKVTYGTQNERLKTSLYIRDRNFPVMH